MTRIELEAAHARRLFGPVEPDTQPTHDAPRARLKRLAVAAMIFGVVVGYLLPVIS